MSDKISCTIISKLLSRRGINHIVTSPGSRNSPLITALDANKELMIDVIIDERMAAFFALGKAQILRNPVAIVCTSGTAVLNYAPAVAEAYYQSIPLIVISADRPAEWIDQDDSQTIRQREILRNIVKASFDLPDGKSTDLNETWYIERTVNEALTTAISGRPGPVHINVQINEPLNSKLPSCDKIRNIADVFTSNRLSKECIQNLVAKATDKKIMLLLGFNIPNAKVSKAVNTLASLPNVVVLAESISNTHSPKVITNIDRTLTQIGTTPQKFIPDILITAGGALVSRHIKTLFRTNKPKAHWAIGKQEYLIDCFKSLTLRIHADSESFFPTFAKMLAKRQENIDSFFGELWHNIANNAAQKHKDFVASAPWSSLVAYDYIMTNFPSECNLQISNGTSIRYVQLSDNRRPHASYCNRGVSGIDGSTSTAVGAATCYSSPTILLTGDMSCAYDIGALSLEQIPHNFKMVVFNNQGGDIFRYIKSTANLSIREKYLCAKPKLPLKKLSEAYGFTYFKINSKNSLSNLWKQFVAEQNKSIMEVIVPPDVNSEILNKYFNTISIKD